MSVRSDNIHEEHQQFPSAYLRSGWLTTANPYSHRPERYLEERHQPSRLLACVAVFATP